MLILMNSAMMPTDGDYRRRSISRSEFAALLRAQPFRSFVGYPETAAVIEQIAGVKVPLSRDETTLGDGDVMLVAKLKYRVGDPGRKGTLRPTADDFEFLRIDFKAD